MHDKSRKDVATQAGVIPAPVLISISEFAGRIGISVSTARRLCYTRSVASVKFNRSLLVPVTEVQRLIAAHLQPALPAAEPMPGSHVARG